MSDMCMACRTVVSNKWIQCPKCKCVRCVPVAEKSSGTDIPIESQKPPFKSEPFPGYIDSLKARIVELEEDNRVLRTSEILASCESTLDAMASDARRIIMFKARIAELEHAFKRVQHILGPDYMIAQATGIPLSEDRLFAIYEIVEEMIGGKV